MTERGETDDTESTDTNASVNDAEGAAANESAGGIESDPERVALLRAVADDVRGESSERKQLANILYRTSDLFDEREDTSPEEIVRNVKTILEVRERGGLDR